MSYGGSRSSPQEEYEGSQNIWSGKVGLSKATVGLVPRDLKEQLGCGGDGDAASDYAGTM